MTCDQALELLCARLDGALTAGEEQALEEHLSACPDCRAAGAQLAALRDAFPDLEEVPAPQGFAQGVMERIRAREGEKRVVPLFKRPRFRALAGLAACAVLAVGLYRAELSRQEQARWDGVAQNFSQNADVALAGAPPQEGPVPYSASEEEGMVYGAVRSTAPAASGCDTDGAERYSVTAMPLSDAGVLTLDRMPEGAWELIPPETPVSPEGLYVSEELFGQIEQLAVEQGIALSVTAGETEGTEFVIVVLEETK